MNPYIEAFNAYLAQNMPKTGCCNVCSILDMLYCCYSQHNTMETEEVKLHFRQLGKWEEAFSLSERDAFFDEVCCLCEAQKRAAFQEGLLAGVLLFKELESVAI